jgi:Reverse transcriptase (RNA-dependent DNA polymerase)
MAIIAKFDLETQQMDAINAFVHCDLDETVFMKFPPGLEKENKVLRLRKALYGSLWAQAVPATLAKGTNKNLQKDGFPRSSSGAMRDAQRRSYCLLQR